MNGNSLSSSIRDGTDLSAFNASVVQEDVTRLAIFGFDQRRNPIVPV
jgi:hypothetical protein